MNWKLIVAGGFAFYVVQWLLSMVTGPLLHQGVLDASYKAHELFWRPELTQDPPDMAALMPRWITVGLLSSFVFAAIYGIVRPVFTGGAWTRGMKFGLMIGAVGATFNAGWSGVFNLPDSLWMWWWCEALVFYVLGGAVLGFVAQKVAPLPASS